MRPDIGIDADFDRLYDSQQADAVAFCPVCGGEIYSYGGECIRCERLRKDEDEDE